MHSPPSRGCHKLTTRLLQNFMCALALVCLSPAFVEGAPAGDPEEVDFVAYYRQALKRADGKTSRSFVMTHSSGSERERAAITSALIATIRSGEYPEQTFRYWGQLRGSALFDGVNDELKSLVLDAVAFRVPTSRLNLTWAIEILREAELSPAEVDLVLERSITLDQDYIAALDPALRVGPLLGRGLIYAVLRPEAPWTFEKVITFVESLPIQQRNSFTWDTYGKWHVFELSDSPVYWQQLMEKQMSLDYTEPGNTYLLSTIVPGVLNPVKNLLLTENMRARAEARLIEMLVSTETNDLLKIDLLAKWEQIIFRNPEAGSPAVRAAIDEAKRDPRIQTRIPPKRTPNGLGYEFDELLEGFRAKRAAAKAKGS